MSSPQEDEPPQTSEPSAPQSTETDPAAADVVETLDDGELPRAASKTPQPFTVRDRGKFSKKQHDAGTRRGLAIASLAVLVVLYGGVGTLFVLGRINADETTMLLAQTGPIPTLAAVVFGFYFGKS